MARHSSGLIVIHCLLLTSLRAGSKEITLDGSSVVSNTVRDASTSEVRRSVRDRCTSCSVKGQVYDGHSRFQYDEGCSRYRCICQCDGTWECPDRYVQDICGGPASGQDHRESMSSSNISSTVLSQTKVSASPMSSSHIKDERCKACVINGKEYPGQSYFTFAGRCVISEDCICYCNGTWACPQETIRNTCSEENATSSRETSSAAISSNAQDGQVQEPSSNCSSNCSNNSSSVGVSSGHNLTTQRISDTGAFYSGCHNCTVGERVIKGNNYFDMVDGCIKKSYCTCYCNGTWRCPERFVENLCEPENPTVSRAESGSCKSCSVKGKIFPGNQYFQVTDGCLEYRNCICFCNGSWSCPKTDSKNKCQGGELRKTDASSSSSCKQCEVTGQIFQGDQYFQFVENCSEYRNCFCKCDGTWSCPEDSVRNICLDNGERTVDTSSCSNCEVHGSAFPGNHYFQVKHGCIEYRNCICHCNGSWSCPGDSARNTCDRAASLYLGLYGNAVTNMSMPRCTTCLAYGKYFKGGEYFDVIDACMSYRKCICRCDGSWDCNNRFAVNICKNDTRRASDNKESEARGTGDKSTIRTTSTVQGLGNQCSFCDARNTVVVGNSFFELTEGCMEYKNCLCRCDGSWECPPQFAQNVCTESNGTATSETRLLMTCSNCVAKGKIVRGGSDFELKEDCTLYKSCRCHCDGRWNCSNEEIQNICVKNATVNTNTCSMCQLDNGVLHLPDSRFRLTEDCIEHTCNCFCNGTWGCPENENRWICQDRCLQCDVDGRLIPNNTQFSHKTGCLQYTCTCHCNGSWACADNTIRDVCKTDATDGCSKCTVSSTEAYEGEKDFVLEQGCLHYKCRCNCDGSYFCPGKQARNQCRGEVLGGCRSCVLSETEIYKGETDFTLRRGCIYHDCKCNCDGSWQCPAMKSRNACLGEVPGGCRVCRLSESEIYRASSFFNWQKGCLIYKCKCNCDGSWSCLGKDARDICKGEVPGGCRSCIISDSEFYLGASSFETVKNCVRYKCRCNCDGSYTCPGHTARRICETGAVTVAPICRSCTVSGTENFVGNSTFYLERGCSQYECMCKCDNSWECPPDKTRDFCAEDRKQITSSSSCKVCRISKDIFPGNTSFKFNSGCFQFDCTCDCSGMWSCNTKNPKNICREREQTLAERPLKSDASTVIYPPDITTLTPLDMAAQISLSGTTFVEPDIRTQEAPNLQDTNSSRTNDITNTDYNNITDINCRSCHVDGREIQSMEEFSLERGCLQYKHCKCFCSGRWQCDEVSDICEDTQTSIVTQEARTYQTKVQVSALNETNKMVTKTSASIKEDSDNVSKNASDETDVFVSDQGILTEEDVNLEGKLRRYAEKRYKSGYNNLKASSTTCQDCKVRGVMYPKRSKFVLRDGCSQRACQCHCDTSWSCSETTLDICNTASRDVDLSSKDQCKDCRVGSDVYISEKDFQINNGCLQYSCYCFCNGSHKCPADGFRNKCQGNTTPSVSGSISHARNHNPKVRALLLTKENGDVIVASKVPGCKDCHVDGKKILTLSNFVKQFGCYEAVCFCQCNGKPSCSSSAFVNVCKLPDRKTSKRKGCQVGRRTHFTRVFAHVENCIQRACVCHDDGNWSCKRTMNDIKVC